MRRRAGPLATVLLLLGAADALADDDDDKPLKLDVTPSPATTDGSTSNPVTTTPPAVAVAAAGRSESSRPIPTSDDRVLYGLAANAHLLLIPGWMLDPFLAAHTDLTSGGFGLSFFRRKGTFDVVLTLDVGFYNPPDGNYLAAGKDPALDTHYTRFRNLDFISLDVAFVWHHDLTRWLALTVGGGVGVGVVTGDIFVLNNGGDPRASVCNAMNARDPEKCFPLSGDSYTTTTGTTSTIGSIRPSDPDFQRKLDATTAAQQACMAANTDGKLDCRDTALHPYYHKSPDKPPVMVVINFQIGFKFKIHRHFNFNVAGGFRTGWVVGGGPEVVF